MKSLFTKLMAVLVVAAMFYGCGSPKQSAETKPTGKRFLWKVQSDKGTIYIVGDNKAAKSSTYPLDPVFDKAFNESNVFIQKVDEKGVTQQEMVKMLSYAWPSNLEKSLKRENYGKLVQYFTEYNIPPQAYNTFKPMLASIIIQGSEMTKSGIGGKNSMEYYFMSKASDKDSVYLFPIKDEFKKSDAVISKHSDDFVAFFLGKLDNTINKADKINEAWKNGDAENYLNLAKYPINDYPELKAALEQLNEQDNEKIASKFEELLTTGKTYFYIADVDDLLDTKGSIIKILEGKNKYKIEQM